MGSTTSQLSIVNRALQLVGYKPISLITENSRGAAAMNRAWLPVVLSELRSNVWSFSVVRKILAASTTTPAFGKSYYYPLPGDFVMLAPPDQYCSYVYGPLPQQLYVGLQGDDWMIENDGAGNLCIVTDQVSPLYVRHVTSNVIETPALFDYNFAESLSASLAMNTCEELTNSNTKLVNIEKLYDDAIELAKKRNAFEKQPIQSKTDTYLTVRL